MKFKLDENLPAEAATVLAEAGHDVSTALGEELGGGADPQVAAQCKAEGRALITLDTDFGNIQLYPPENHPGLIVLRLVRQDKQAVLTVLTRLLEKFDREPLAGRLGLSRNVGCESDPGISRPAGDQDIV
jgi:predicted nuclease of predicted toxin-antitoxin system